MSEEDADGHTSDGHGWDAGEEAAHAPEAGAPDAGGPQTHGHDARERHAEDRGGGRSAPEWTSLAICSAVLVVVVALLVSELLGASAPALPLARVAAVSSGGATSVVDVEVRNGGDESATDVQVHAALTIGGDVEEADVVVPFLGGGETEQVVFTFTADPADGELEVRVTSFLVP